jgi:preprotein translocase subunit SecE
MQNTKKWIQICFLFVAAMAWVFFYYLSDTVWDLAELPIPADWFIMPPQIIAFVAAIVTFIILQRNTKVNQFSNEVASELTKVTWPEKKETLMSAGVISVMVAICALILFAFDSLWGTLVRIMYD